MPFTANLVQELTIKVKSQYEPVHIVGKNQQAVILEEVTNITYEASFDGFKRYDSVFGAKHGINTDYLDHLEHIIVLLYLIQAFLLLAHQRKAVTHSLRTCAQPFA